MAVQLYGKDADAFLKLYPVSTIADIPVVAAKVARESTIAIASRNCGVLQMKYNSSKVYIDMYDHKHPYAPGVEIADQDVSTAGAYHNADIIYWFENLDVFNNIRHTRDWTAWDHKLADNMSDALIAFAKTGKPETAAVKRPAWSPAEDVFVDFGESVRTEKFNTQGMEWLAAHTIRGGACAPGSICGAGPRD